MQIVSADGLTCADSAGLMDVSAQAATLTKFFTRFDRVAQTDEFGSTLLRDTAARNHRQPDGGIVRLGAA